MIGSFLYTIFYIAVQFGLWFVGVFLDTKSTRYDELKLIGQGNKAVAVSFVGKMIGIAIVISTVAEYSVSLIDLVIFGLFGAIIQIVVFHAIERLTPRYDIQGEIENGKFSVGLVMAGVAVAVGLMVSGALTYNPLL